MACTRTERRKRRQEALADLQRCGRMPTGCLSRAPKCGPDSKGTAGAATQRRLYAQLLRELVEDSRQPGLVRLRAADRLMALENAEAGDGRSEAPVPVVESMRIRQARKTGDERVLLEAMKADAEEVAIILGALGEVG